MSNHQIVSIERTPGWWRCKTLTGETVNVFAPKPPKPGTLRFFEGAGYDLAAMPVGSKLRFNRYPIGVTLLKDGEYWSVYGVEDRPDGAGADEPFVPQAWMYRDPLRSWAQLLLEQSFVIWDCETTGLQIQFDEIVQIGWIDQYETIFEPHYGSEYIYPSDINLLTQRNGAGETHGITADMLANAMDFPTVLNSLRDEILHGRLWVGYNLNAFDAPLLERLCAAFGQEPVIPLATVDVMDYAARYIGEWDAERERWRNWKLTEAAAILGIATDGAHDALADCKMTLAIIEAIAGGIEPDRGVMERIAAEREVVS